MCQGTGRPDRRKGTAHPVLGSIRCRRGKGQGYIQKVIYCKHKDYEQLIEIKDCIAQTIQADADLQK